MDYRVCVNCCFRDPFTYYCRFRHTSPTPFYWCPAWYDSTWISMLFSTKEDDDDKYEDFLKELVN